MKNVLSFIKEAIILICKFTSSLFLLYPTFFVEYDSYATKKQKIKENKSVKKTAKLMDIETNDFFYDKLTYVQIHIPLFVKEEDELETIEDKWFYIIRNLQRFQNRPAALEERIFDKQERMAYEDSLKNYRDIKNVIDTAIDTAKEEKAVEMAKNFIKKGYSFEDIADGTGLSIEQVNEIANSLKQN